jgi:hypothetical protein
LRPISYVEIHANQTFPPSDEALEAADKVVGSLAELTETVVADVAGGRR